MPNNNNLHYLFTTLTSYKTALTSYLAKSVTLDNYRINTNVIKVKIDETLTEAIADTLTYAIDERIENNVTKYFRCYHVNRVTIQSGYVILNCSVDYWASYLLKAQFSKINVLRCNRRVGIGMLDELDGTYGNVTRSYCAITGYSSGSNNELYDRSKVYIVFALKYNIAQNSAGSVSRIGLYAFNLTDLVTRLYNAQSDSDPNKKYYSIVNPVQLAVDVVSGIYGVNGVNMWGITGTLNAVVIGAWFTDNVACIMSENTQIKTKANWHNFNDVTITPYEVITAEATKTLTITNDFNKQFYIGTRQNGLKLKRTTEATISVNIKTIPSEDKLTIIAYQGDNQQDITDAFSVVVGTTDGDITTERQVLDVVQNSIRAVGGAIALGKGLSSGNGFATALGVTNLAGGLADDIGKGRSNHIGNMVKGGDGALAYYRVFTGQDLDNPTNNLNTPITNPYVINAFASINDENVNVRLYGAKFSEAMASLASVFTHNLMGSGSNNDPTYLQANVNVDGIPTEASDKIKASLQQGINLINLT